MNFVALIVYPSYLSYVLKYFKVFSSVFWPQVFLIENCNKRKVCSFGMSPHRKPGRKVVAYVRDPSFQELGQNRQHAIGKGDSLLSSFNSLLQELHSCGQGKEIGSVLKQMLFRLFGCQGRSEFYIISLCVCVHMFAYIYTYRDTGSKLENPI